MRSSNKKKREKKKEKRKLRVFEVCDLEWAMLAVSNNGQACSVRRGSPRQQTISKNGATIQNVQKTGVMNNNCGSLRRVHCDGWNNVRPHFFFLKNSFRRLRHAIRNASLCLLRKSTPPPTMKISPPPPITPGHLVG